ncbi:MAG: hypothetical protein U0841_32505, partial [Chloroflexia bacterium]
MTRSLQRVMAGALVFLMVLNVTNLLLPALASAAMETEIAPLSVSPQTATAGAALSVAGAGFRPDEALLALIVTPNRQTLNLGAVGDGQTVVITDAPTALLAADANGAVAFSLLTAANYQTGGWALVVRGRDSGLESWGQFTLTGAAEPELATATPVASSAPSAPPPTAAPQPSVAPSSTPAPSVAPSTAPATTPVASVTPVASGTPVAAGSATPEPSAAPSGTPVATAVASP